MPAIVKYKLFNLRTWLFGLLSILGLWAHIHADIRDGVRTVSSAVLRVVRVVRVVRVILNVAPTVLRVDHGEQEPQAGVGGRLRDRLYGTHLAPSTADPHPNHRLFARPQVIRNKKVPERWYPGRFDIFVRHHVVCVCIYIYISIYNAVVEDG